MKREIKLLAASALLAVTSVANAGNVDLFTTPQGFLTDDTLSDGGLSNFADGGTDILGGSRDLYVELNDSLDPANLNTQIGVVGGLFTFSVDNNAKGTGIVQWDGADHSPTLDLAVGLGGIDLTEGGNLNSFQVDVDDADLDFFFSINAYTSATQFTQALLISNITSGIAIINFSDFLNCGLSDPASGIVNIACAGGNNPVDFTNLVALELVIAPNVIIPGITQKFTLDMSLNSITTVPEPSVLGLMGAGLFVVGMVSRRRKDKSLTA